MKTKIDIMQALKDTGRTMYVDEEVAKFAPQHTGKLEFFKLEKWMTCQELADEYEKRSLMPASILSLCEYDKTNREDLDKMQYVCSQWKDKKNKWCYVSVSRWGDGGRSVYVSRYDRGWGDRWWGCGVRNLALSTGDSELLEPQSSVLYSDLEKRVKVLEDWAKSFNK